MVIREIMVSHPNARAKQEIMVSLPNVDTRNYGSPTLRFEDDKVENDMQGYQARGHLWTCI